MQSFLHRLALTACLCTANSALAEQVSTQPVQQRLALPTQFAPAPLTLQVTAQPRDAEATCSNARTQTSDVEISAETTAPLLITLSQGLSLFVEDPAGGLHCSNSGVAEAQVRFPHARAGMYRVWIGGVAGTPGEIRFSSAPP